MNSIAIIGSNMVDLISYISRIPTEGETLEASSFQMGHGGKGANQAVAAAKMGSNVVMVSKVGDDMFADSTLMNFKSYGINTEFVHKVKNTASGVAPIFVSPTSQNSILIIKGANNNLYPKDIDHAKHVLEKCQLIILQLEVPLETVYYAIEFGNIHNIPVLLNPAPALPELDIDYACRCDFFVPNETELEILVNKPVTNLNEIKQAAQVLLDKGLKNIIVTMGEKGSLWLSKNGDNIHIQPTTVNAKDTSGAGDAFIGCFSHFFVLNGNVVEAMKEASLFSALSVTEKGTQLSYPTLEQFNKFKKSKR
jgi:ribokinase